MKKLCVRVRCEIDVWWPASPPSLDCTAADTCRCRRQLAKFYKAAPQTALQSTSPKLLGPGQLSRKFSECGDEQSMRKNGLLPSTVLIYIKNLHCQVVVLDVLLFCLSPPSRE